MIPSKIKVEMRPNFLNHEVFTVGVKKKRKKTKKNGNVRKRNGHKQRVVGNISRLPNWNLRKNSLNSIQIRFNLPFESSRLSKRQSVLRVEGK